MRALAWAAGLFEGEGCISFRNPATKSHKNAVWGTWSLRLSMTDEDVVRRFAAITQVGNVRLGPTKPPRKPIWLWIASAKGDVTRILHDFMPYLGERRRAKAEEALAYIRTQPGSGRWSGGVSRLAHDTDRA